jgi:hypothetical protein
MSKGLSSGSILTEVAFNNLMRHNDKTYMSDPEDRVPDLPQIPSLKASLPGEYSLDSEYAHMPEPDQIVPDVY